MPRIRKKPNRYWSKEDKLKIILLELEKNLTEKQNILIRGRYYG